MGHPDLNLHDEFRRIDLATSKPRFFRNTAAFEQATRDFVSELQAIHYNRPYVRLSEKLLIDDYGSKVDRSGNPEIEHPMTVGDNSYRLARWCGYSQDKAESILIAMRLHDYLENGLKRRNGVGLNDRYKILCKTFDDYDPDIENMILSISHLRVGESNPGEREHYLMYQSRIGSIDYLKQAPEYAHIIPSRLNMPHSVFTGTKQDVQEFEQACCIGKVSDGENNREPARRMYIEQVRADFETSGNKELGKLVSRLDTKQLQYDIAVDYLTAKLDGLIKPSATTYAFLISKNGQCYMTEKYRDAIKSGLGDELYERLLLESGDGGKIPLYRRIVGRLTGNKTPANGNNLGMKPAA